MKMNKRKLLIFAGLSFLAITKIFAGSNEKGIDYFNAELYDAAKIFFLQQSDLSLTDQAENYYYLGQTYYKLDRVDSASYYYQKTIQSFPEYAFGYIGAGKLELKKGNTKVAEDFFKKANSYAKKNPAVQTTIAEIYVDAGDYNNAIIALDKARKVNSKYSGIYIVEGDMLMKQGKIGEACSRYDNAILFNNSDKVAYLKSARIYKDINSNMALNYLNQLVALDPDYIPAYSVIGDIHREVGRYQRALEAYEKFITIPGVPMQQHEYYAQSLFFADQYDKALEQFKFILSKDPNNLIIKRLEAYNSLRLENYALGIEQMNHFLEVMPKERQIYQDYITLAQLAVKEKQLKLALEAFQKAIDFDPEKAANDGLYKEMTSVASSAKLYPEAVQLYEKYFAVETSPVNSDYYFFGNACYSAASYYTVPENMAFDNEAKFKEYIQKGDKAYVELNERNTNAQTIHMGYLGRANIYSLVDKYDEVKGRKIEWYAKPYFEKAIEVMLENNADGARNNDIITSYQYLISYYTSINDMPSVIDYSKRILLIDPNNAQAKSTLDQILQYFRKILKADPNNVQAKNILRLLGS